MKASETKAPSSRGLVLTERDQEAPRLAYRFGLLSRDQLMALLGIKSLTRINSKCARWVKENEPKRQSLYKHVAELIRAFANLANELQEAGYTADEIDALKAEVGQFEKVREEVKLASGDYIDLKMYEPAMRHLIDTYIRAEDSKKIASFDDIPLVQLIVERGADAVAALPKGIRDNREAAAETIENNVRKLIIDEQPLNPKYYDKMSELLDLLIAQRKKEALNYQKYLEQIVALAKKVVNPASGDAYPKDLDTPGKRALFDNLGKDQAVALAVDRSIRENRQDDWRNNPFKIRKSGSPSKLHLVTMKN
jgi:type I restriction enzyme R subunit